MFGRPKPRLTYANVTATIALFLALGGSAYAVTSLPNSTRLGFGIQAAAAAAGGVGFSATWAYTQG